MKVLVACEESQRVCTAFRELGHEAYSCDIQECSGGHPEWHIQGDVLPLINGNCTLPQQNQLGHIARPALTHMTIMQSIRVYLQKIGQKIARRHLLV